MAIPSALDRPTLPIPEAGYLAFGADRHRSYRLAREGVLPTIPLGKRRRVVPTAALRTLLGMDPNR